MSEPKPEVIVRKKETLTPNDKLDKTRYTFLRQGSHFINPNGSWSESEKHVKNVITYGEVIDSLIEDLKKAVDEYNKAALAACTSAPKLDTLFYDSPVSPANVLLNLRRHLKKSEVGIIRDVHEPSVTIRSFSEMTKDACKWILKFKNEPS